MSGPMEVRENFGMTLQPHGGDEQPNVRADLVYFTTPNDGAVFSTGSIAWCSSLSHNNYDNNVSRITENVLRRFESDDRLPETRRMEPELAASATAYSGP
jgi:N,N-dimethylformamidase